MSQQAEAGQTLDDFTLEEFSNLRRLRTVMVTAWLVVIIGVTWSLLGAYIGIYEISYIAGIAIFSSLSAIILGNLGFDLIGRSMWFIGGILAVTTGSLMVHPDGDTEYMFAAMIGGPFILFSLNREKHIITVLVTTDILAWAAVRYYRSGYEGDYLIGQDIAQTYISLPSMLTTLMIIGLEMWLFAYITFRYNTRLHASNQEAMAASRAKSEFLAAMSHEIRTPMNGVVGMLEVLDNSDLTMDQRRMLRTVRDSSFSLLRIIDDILDMSKIEAGKLELRPTPSHLLSTLESAVENMRSMADTKNVSLSFLIDPKLPEWITCDNGRLRQIILNLLSNAIKFSSRPLDEDMGQVQFRVSLAEGDVLEIVIEDDGIGMDEETQRKVFQPFSQSEEVAKRRIGGTGLGLTIVSQLVEKMGGTISVTSEVGIGSKFTATLPIVAASGKLSVPDLRTSVFIGYVNPPLRRAKLDSLIKATKAQITWAETEEHFYELFAQAPDHAIAVLADVHDDVRSIRELNHRFSEKYPTRRQITASRARSSRFGVISDTTYVLQWAPLLPSEAWKALAVSAGKQSPDIAVQGFEQLEAPRATAAQKARILVAEDNEINQVVIRHQLDMLGYPYVMTDNGKQCLEQWRTGEFDLVLTDCHMPEMDGFELTGVIRDAEAAHGTRRTPIIAITANALVGEAEKCIASGMDDYLSKPVKLNHLSNVLKRWTNEKGA